MYNTGSSYEPIRNGRYFDATTDLDELVASSDSSGGDMRMVLKRLLVETKRTNTEYQIINIHRPSLNDYREKFKVTIQLTRHSTDFAFTLNQDYPFQPPLQMTVNGTSVNHERYAALEWIGGPSRTIPYPKPMPNLYARSHHLLCEEVKQELGALHRGRKCFFCQLYRSGTWSPSKFLGTLVDEYLAVRADIVGAIRRGVARKKLMEYRVCGGVRLPEEIVEEILEWV